MCLPVGSVMRLLLIIIEFNFHSPCRKLLSCKLFSQLLNKNRGTIIINSFRYLLCYYYSTLSFHKQKIQFSLVVIVKIQNNYIPLPY